MRLLRLMLYSYFRAAKILVRHLECQQAIHSLRKVPHQFSQATYTGVSTTPTKS